VWAAVASVEAFVGKINFQNSIGIWSFPGAFPFAMVRKTEHNSDSVIGESRDPPSSATWDNVDEDDEDDDDEEEEDDDDDDEDEDDVVLTDVDVVDLTVVTFMEGIGKTSFQWLLSWLCPVSSLDNFS
jgi:hypothetical protein